MKSKRNTKKLYPLLLFLLFGLLNTLNLSSGIAIHMQGGGVTFNPNDDYPTQYGVFIPVPNIFATMSIQGSNQGEFTMMDWKGAAIDGVPVLYPGQDISHLYPLYFNDYISETPTNNNFTDPWSTNWINITAFNPHSVNLSQYSLNSVFNYYILREGDLLNIPLNSSIPLQLDILISGIGPKILKFDWLTDDPTINLIDDLALVSPSGKLLNWDIGLVDSSVNGAPNQLFYYFAFVAHEKGTYRLLIKADYAKSTFLTLEFKNTPLSLLPLNTLVFGGYEDDSPNTQDAFNLEWENIWYKINGEAGDIFKLDIGIDFEGIDPAVNLWIPCENGYLLNQPLDAGVYDIIFPMTGTAYVSFIDETFNWWYRYSLFLSETKTVNYAIGDDITTFKVSGGERKAIIFEIDETSFVRFNYTFPSPPLGDPSIYAPGVPTVPFGFIYEDSKKLECLDIITYVDMKTIDTKDFFYYYLPNGTYMAFIANDDVRYDGIIQISSKIIENSGFTVPHNSLTYSDTNPSQVLTIEFEPDDFYDELYEAKYVSIDITEPGQYILNTTIYASDYLASLPALARPSVVVFYNSTENEYYDYTTNASSPDNQNFPIFTEKAEALYIAFPGKWHDMHFNFSQLGVSNEEEIIETYVYNGNTFVYLDIVNDTTNDFENNGTWISDIYLDPTFLDWEKGNNRFDLTDVAEDDFYWLYFSIPDNNYTDGGETIPIIDFIQLSNITAVGDVNLALVGESGYEFCNFWEPVLSQEPINMILNREADASQNTKLFSATSPFANGFEEGLYKLLIIPRGWDPLGTLTVQLSVENHWSYRQQETYNITAISPIPNLYQYQIRNYTDYGYSQDNVIFYNYGLTTTYNNTESIPTDLGSNSYFVLECFGDAYQWTQLVVSSNNVTEYDLYIIQDLPWIDNTGPNGEVMQIPTTTVNSTYEFGVLTDHFYLIFEVDAFNDTVTFRLDLNQYNTTEMLASVTIASYSSPSGFDTGFLLILAIAIPAAVGAVILLYVFKRKGRIFSKTP